MSDTDKTKPWRVRMNEHHPVATHDHRAGICDLSSSPITETGNLSDLYCHWSARTIWGYGGGCCTGCGCRMCTAYHFRRAERRRSRHRAKTAARKAVTTGNWQD